MNFVLVPFLLASRLVVNDDAWNNGPEYTFGVRASMITNLKGDECAYRGTCLVSKLRCRPKEPDSLICRFEDAAFARLTPRDFDPRESKPDKNATYTPYSLRKTTFEIKFNEKGIESYAIENDDRATGPFLSNMYRMLANQLSVGAVVGEKPSNFEVSENFTVGECPVAFEVSRNRIVNERDAFWRWKGFEIEPLIDVKLGPNEVLTILKNRNIGYCSVRKLYFFGTRHTYGIVPRDTIETLRSSASRLIITRHSFYTETLNVVDLLDSERKDIGSVMDHLVLSLESIDPAQGDLKPIANPVLFNVVVDTAPRKM